MRLAIRACTALFLALSCGGCISQLFPTVEPSPPVGGFLYTDVSFPLTENHRGEPLTPPLGKGDVKSIHYPLSAVRVSWDSNAIGEIAKQNGIEKIYFADMHVFSVFFGLWNQYEVRIVGETAPKKEMP